MYQIERHWGYQISIIRAIFYYQGEGIVTPSRTHCGVHLVDSQMYGSPNIVCILEYAL